METKRIYTEPLIATILLDNEISLALESSPPLGPGEEVVYNQLDPFKSNKV